MHLLDFPKNVTSDECNQHNDSLDYVEICEEV
jgi:hypothetical protein